jgi:hypothetical protein
VIGVAQFDVPSIEVTEKLALADLIEEGPSAGVSIPDAVGEFISTPGIEGTELAAELQEAIVPAADRTEATEGLKDIWEKIKNVFSSRRDIVVDSDEVQLPLGIYWLDVPNVPGAKVAFSVSTEKQATVAATVKIAGIGGGPSSTTTVKGKVGYETSGGTVLTVTVPATVERIETRRGGEVEAVFTRLSAFRWDQRTWTPSPLSEPLAGVGSLIERPTFDNRSGKGTFSEELTVERGTSWQYSIGLKVPKLSLDLSIESTGSYAEAVGYAYTLPGGHLYVAARFDAPPCFIWTIDSP